MEGWLDTIAIKIGSHTLILICDLVVTAYEFPLSVRLQINCETTILQFAIEVVNGSLNDTTTRVKIFEEVSLARVSLSVDRDDTLLTIHHQSIFEDSVYFFSVLLLLTRLCTLFTHSL